MARNGTGTYSLPGSPFVAGTTAVSADVNSKLSDIATALTASVAKDGQTTPTANLPMGNFKHTGVAVASARTEYASAAQVQDGGPTWAGTTAGSATAYTATVAPGGVALVSGLTVRTKLHATSGISPTFALNGLTAKKIVYFSRRTSTFEDISTADLVVGQVVELCYELAQDRWILLSGLADPDGWYVASESVNGAAVSTVDFLLPAANRYRFEFGALSGSSAADLFMRYSRDGGASYLAGASDYGYVHNGDAPVGPVTFISLVGGTVAENVTGVLEMDPTGRGKCVFHTASVITPAEFRNCSGMGASVNGTDINAVRFGFVGVNVASHRIRLLAQRA